MKKAYRYILGSRKKPSRFILTVFNAQALLRPAQLLAPSPVFLILTPHGLLQNLRKLFLGTRSLETPANEQENTLFVPMATKYFALELSYPSKKQKTKNIMVPLKPLQPASCPGRRGRTA